MTDVMRIHESIAALAPIDGVRIRAGRVEVDFRPEATAQQRQAALAAAASADTRPRRPRQRAALREAVASLTPQQRQALTVEVIAAALESDPGLARRLGIAIDGDESA